MESEGEVHYSHLFSAWTEIFHAPAHLFSDRLSQLQVQISVFLFSVVYGQLFGSNMLCISLCRTAHTYI